MVGVAAIAYGLSLRPGGVAAALPVLGVFILGARRLVPAVQALYGGWATINSSQASIADMLMLLEQPIGEEYARAPAQPLEFLSAVEFRNVSFRYQPTGLGS